MVKQYKMNVVSSRWREQTVWLDAALTSCNMNACFHTCFCFFWLLTNLANGMFCFVMSLSSRCWRAFLWFQHTINTSYFKGPVVSWSRVIQQRVQSRPQHHPLLHCLNRQLLYEEVLIPSPDCYWTLSFSSQLVRLLDSLASHFVCDLFSAAGEKWEKSALTGKKGFPLHLFLSSCMVTPGAPSELNSLTPPSIIALSLAQDKQHHAGLLLPIRTPAVF